MYHICQTSSKKEFLFQYILLFNSYTAKTLANSIPQAVSSVFIVLADNFRHADNKSEKHHKIDQY